MKESGLVNVKRNSRGKKRTRAGPNIRPKSVRTGAKQRTNAGKHGAKRRVRGFVGVKGHASPLLKAKGRERKKSQTVG